MFLLRYLRTLLCCGLICIGSVYTILGLARPVLATAGTISWLKKSSKGKLQRHDLGIQ